MSRHDECCSDKCSSGLRNNYFEGKRITAHSFEVEQKYMIDRRQLMNRAVYGWGVVYGYEIKTVDDAERPGAGNVSIGPGLALDKHGRELVLTEKHLGLKDVLVIVDYGDPRPLENLKDDEAEGQWILSVHYAERSLGLVKVNDPCECERDQWDHTCETVRFFLRRAENEKECCQDFDCELDCKCTKGGCCQDGPKREHPDTAQHDVAAHNSPDAVHILQGDPAADAQRVNPHEERRPPTKTQKRGGCRCLCDHLTHLPLLDDDHALCKIKEACGEVLADLTHYVDLACVILVKDSCNKWTLDNVDACGPRRLVKRNDLLFDLIRGCDLTRIEAIGWTGWHRNEKEPMPFEKFSHAFRTKNSGGSSDSPRFTVRFSRAVKSDTVRPDCFAMTVMTGEREGGWLETFRVPIVDVLPSDKQKMEANEVQEVEIIVDDGWLEDAVFGRKSIFKNSETWVEFEVRGSFIVDCNGQTVDADARGLDQAPSGNGTPGGTFLSTFQVAPASEGLKRVQE